MQTGKMAAERDATVERNKVERDSGTSTPAWWEKTEGPEGAPPWKPGDELMAVGTFWG
jgi:hypothetical protein